MNDSGIKIEVHLIQNFAPSNLNRDDTGQPKSAIFGGFRRARISSQCGKRTARDWWRKRGAFAVGDRTKKIQKLIGDKLAQDKEFTNKVTSEEGRKDGIRIFMDAYYAAPDKKKPDNTNVLIFISPGEVDVCAQVIKELWDDRTKETTKKGKQGTETIEGIGSIIKKLHTEEKPETEQAGDGQYGEETGDKNKPKKPKLNSLNEIKERIKAAQVTADIALFGRMLAEQPERNTDGSCQVAHPLSTHKVDMEMDFYTAVDDLNPAEETGAGMMGVIGFNSACYYRYALVDRDQLARNLSRKTERKNGKWAVELEANDYQEADKVIEAFLQALVYAIPTGKQNSFAAQNLPSFGLFVRRQGGVPISLANAFAKPVKPKKDDDDLVGLSVAGLTKHWDALKKVYGDQGIQVTACFHVEQDDRLNGLSDFDEGSVENTINAVMKPAKKQ